MSGRDEFMIQRNQPEQKERQTIVLPIGSQHGASKSGRSKKSKADSDGFPPEIKTKRMNSVQQNPKDEYGIKKNLRKHPKTVMEGNYS